VTPALVQRLAEDPWPLVRIAAADALAESSFVRDCGASTGSRSRTKNDSPPRAVREWCLAPGRLTIATAGALPKESVSRLADKDEWAVGAPRPACPKRWAALCWTRAPFATLTNYAQQASADPMSDGKPEHLIGAASLSGAQ